jgi:hypothetical protein
VQTYIHEKKHTCAYKSVQSAKDSSYNTQARAHTHTHTLRDTYSHKNIHACIHTYIHNALLQGPWMPMDGKEILFWALNTYLNTYMHSYIHTYIHTQCTHIGSVDANGWKRDPISGSKYLHTYMHACMHTYIHNALLQGMWAPMDGKEIIFQARLRRPHLQYRYMHMYACMHVCVCMYVCMYVCTYMYVCIY